jgi:L-rhamnose isomerase
VTTPCPVRQQEIVWGGSLGRVRIGLDYFDAGINRVAAWVIGTRNMSKALLLALLAPIGKLKQAELEGDYTTRLALMEDAKLLPAGAVWDYHCAQHGVPIGEAWLAEVKRYEREVLRSGVKSLRVPPWSPPAPPPNQHSEILNPD